MQVFLRWVLTALLVPMALHFGSPTIVQAQAKTEIVIGASLPLTGSLAAHGRYLKWAYDQIVNSLNENGGILVKDSGKKLKIRLVIADNGTNPMRAASAVEKLIKVDKVDMLLGGADPACVMAGCMAAERYKTYYHGAFGFPMQAWLEKKFKWSTDFFFATDQACAAPFEVLRSIEADKRPKKVGIAVEDSFGGNGLAAGLRATGKKFGYNIDLVVKLPVGAQDYSEQITKIKQSGVDALLTYASVQDLERLVKQLKSANVSIPYIHAWKGGWAGTFWKDLGKDAQFIVTDGFWSMDYPFNGAKELGQKYYEAFKEYSVTVGLPYALAQSLFQAIEKAGSVDGAKVREAVLSNTFDTVMGPVKYQQNGSAVFPSNASQWWDGKQMLVYPSQYATWKVKLAPPWNRR